MLTKIVSPKQGMLYSTEIMTLNLTRCLLLSLRCQLLDLPPNLCHQILMAFACAERIS